MATIYFSSRNLGIDNLNGSGLGFYLDAFGQSVAVASYQETTWVTDSTGTIQGPQLDNIKYVHPASGEINGAAAQNLLNMPNYLATLNIRFNHTSPIQTQNAQFRVYDRNNINNNPSGVTCKVAELIHPSLTQTGLLGSGDSSWITTFGSGSIVDLISSPGVSGLRPSGASTINVQHDWYLAISSSPNSVGSKTFAGYFSVEYL